VTLPILFLFGSPEPFSALTAAFEQLGGGRALELDVERAVLVDRDQHADHLPVEVGAHRVELRDELPRG
jgi:hypothetical protein